MSCDHLWDCPRCRSEMEDAEDRIAELEADQRRLEWLINNDVHFYQHRDGTWEFYNYATNRLPLPNKNWRDSMDEAMGESDALGK